MFFFGGGSFSGKESFIFFFNFFMVQGSFWVCLAYFGLLRVFCCVYEVVFGFVGVFFCFYYFFRVFCGLRLFRVFLVCFGLVNGLSWCLMELFLDI